MQWVKSEQITDARQAKLRQLPDLSRLPRKLPSMASKSKQWKKILLHFTTHMMHMMTNAILT